MDKYINKAEAVNSVNILIRKQREENYFDSVYDALSYLKGLLWAMDSVSITPGEDSSQQDTVAVSMTVEEWEAVRSWLTFGADKCKASMVWWRDFCDNKKIGAETAAMYERQAENADRICKIIEETLYPQPPKETE